MNVMAAKEFSFLNGLDEDLKSAVLEQLRNLWTHTSTAIEGNSLTLGETMFVIKEGLTISGKPLKDHREVYDHAKAVDVVFNMVKAVEITKEDIFRLHKTIQTENITDILKPVGAWKVEINGTVSVRNGKQVYIEYAHPSDVNALMMKWVAAFNRIIKQKLSQSEVLQAYTDLQISFLRIHPFWDGNGRMSRLLSNLPVLKSGFPPILIPKEKKYEYIKILSENELHEGVITPAAELFCNNKYSCQFIKFCESLWESSTELVEKAYERQRERNTPLDLTGPPACKPML